MNSFDKMKIDDLMLPARITNMFVNIINGEKSKNIDNLEYDYHVSETLLCKMFLEMGAVQHSKMKIQINKNELIEQPLQLQLFASPGEVHLPRELVDVMKKDNVNLLRAIMTYKKLELKDVALKYGGKSAAANISNFLARTNEELMTARPKTLQRLALAFDCPDDWLLRYFQKH